MEEEENGRKTYGETKKWKIYIGTEKIEYYMGMEKGKKMKMEQKEEMEK
jgi:hypothetical protein